MLYITLNVSLYFLVGEYHLVEVQERARVRRGADDHVKFTLKVADIFYLVGGQLGINSVRQSLTDSNRSNKYPNDPFIFGAYTFPWQKTFSIFLKRCNLWAIVVRGKHDFCLFCLNLYIY